VLPTQLQGEALLLGGGIGITPLRAQLLQAGWADACIHFGAFGAGANVDGRRYRVALAGQGRGPARRPDACAAGLRVPPAAGPGAGLRLRAGQRSGLGARLRL